MENKISTGQMSYQGSGSTYGRGFGRVCRNLCIRVQDFRFNLTKPKVGGK